MKKDGGVWIYGECKNDQVESVVFELLGKGREIADELSKKLSVVLITDYPYRFTEEFECYGVDQIYIVPVETYKQSDELACTHILSELILKYQPEIMLLGATLHGQSVGPRLAARLNTGLTADCTRLEIDKDRELLLQTRPAFGGMLLATIICQNSRPQMATVRPGILRMPKLKEHKKTTVICCDFIREFTTQIESLKKENRLHSFNNLEKADIIIGVGRGIGSKENLKIVEKIAKCLDAAIGATREVVEAGWLSYEHQIGQTGKVVSPKIYIACGISGSVQHVAGIRTADCIIAINKDKKAPILEAANWAIVNDLNLVLPLFLQELNKVYRFELSENEVTGNFD